MEMWMRCDGRSRSNCVWMMKAGLMLGLIACFAVPAMAAKGAKPDFGPNVAVFDPSMPSAAIQAEIDKVYAVQRRNEFGSERNALLFLPGEYKVDVPVGFYTEVLGLGASPDGVHITGNVHSDAASRNDNATTTFWRAAEGFSVTPTGGTMQWAVSQAVPFRRMHVRGNMVLNQKHGWASGGWMSDSLIDGNVDSGTQQQWISRNCEWGSWTGANWNMVFVGVPHPPAGEWPDPPYTKIAQTPVVREKPFLAGGCRRQVQRARSGAAHQQLGHHLAWRIHTGEIHPAEQVLHCAAGRRYGGEHQCATGQGQEPAVYAGHLRTEGRHPRDAAQHGGAGAWIRHAEADQRHGRHDHGRCGRDHRRRAAVRCGRGEVAGAARGRAEGKQGPAREESHLAARCFLPGRAARESGARWGIWRSTATTPSSITPGSGGRTMARASAGTATPSANGLVVNGNDVTIYGLFVEHHQQFQVLWNGNGGRTYFYQSEIPYDPPTQASYTSASGPNGWASYKVADGVTSHEAWGLGIYSVFRHPDVVLSRAIEVPKTPACRFHHMITVSLDDKGEISNVINDTGGAATAGTKTRPRVIRKVTIYP